MEIRELYDLQKDLSDLKYNIDSFNDDIKNHPELYNMSEVQDKLNDFLNAVSDMIDTADDIEYELDMVVDNRD